MKKVVLNDLCNQDLFRTIRRTMNRRRSRRPEGDNEMAPDQPLQPSADIAVEGLRNPRGAEPNDDYKKDHD